MSMNIYGLVRCDSMSLQTVFVCWWKFQLTPTRLFMPIVTLGSEEHTPEHTIPGHESGMASASRAAASSSSV